MTKQASSREYSDDAPKTDPWTEDVLGFAPFAERFATSLLDVEAPRGFVVGLHGEWGSGKSTMLNFTRGFLDKWIGEKRPGTENLVHFTFDPWIISGQQDVTGAFFKVLSENIGDKADKWRLWKRRSAKATNMSAGPILDAAAKLGVVFDHTGGTASSAGAAIAKGAISAATRKWLDEPSLQATYKSLAERLGSSKRRFIVFIDDIDRLTGEEIRALMQMVKTVGRLPNIIYCLAYDRDIVWAALRNLAHGDDKRSGYAEKIVQHEVEVPVPGRSGLLGMLNKELAGIPGPPKLSQRWHELIGAGIHRWVRHPRDVLRLANAVKFTWPALEGEIDPQDLLCMEGLRLFDRAAFEWVRTNRDTLLGHGIPGIDPQDAEHNAEELGRTLGKNAKADIVLLLRLLFPNKRQMFGPKRHDYNVEQWSNVVVRRGIATPAGYTAYFSLAPSPSAIPKRLIDEAVNTLSDRTHQGALLKDAISRKDEGGRSLVAAYLQELQYRFHSNPALPVEHLFQALLDLHEEIQGVDGSGAMSNPSTMCRLTVIQLIERLNPDRVAALLKSAFAEPGRLGALTAIYTDVARMLGILPAEGLDRRELIAANELDELGAMLLLKIENSAKDGSLANLHQYYDVGHAWSHLASAELPRAWIARQALSCPRELVKVTRGLLGYSLGEESVRYNVYSNPGLHFYDISALKIACAKFADAPNLNTEERERIAALQRGIPTLERYAQSEREGTMSDTPPD